MEKVYEMIDCIQKAFPEGIDEEYRFLIAYLYPYFTKQNLAALLSYVSGKDVLVVQNDMERYKDEKITEEMIQKLKEAGFVLADH